MSEVGSPIARALLLVVSHSVYLPCDLSVLDGWSPDSVSRAVRTLRKNKVLLLAKANNLRHLRLSRPIGIDALKSVSEAHYEQYMLASANHRLTGDEMVVRNGIRHAQVLMMMDSIGIGLEHEVPPLRETEDANINQNQEPLDKGAKLYYSSKDLKLSGGASKPRLTFSRIQGILLSPGGYYPVYNTGKGLITWKRSGELDAKIFLEKLISTNFDNDFFIKQNEKYPGGSCIVFGSDYDTARDIIISPYKTKKEIESHLQVANIYANTHFVPLNLQEGKATLAVLTTANWQNRILRMIVNQEAILKARQNHSIFDAIVGDLHIFEFFSGNLSRLKTIKTHYDDNQLKNKQCRILCYPNQKEFIESFFGPDMEIACLEPNRMIDALAPGSPYAIRQKT